MSFVYKQAHGDPLWVTGHYDGEGRWEPEADLRTKEAAARRVAWLNGGGGPEPVEEPPPAPPPNVGIYEDAQGAVYLCSRGELWALGLPWQDPGLVGTAGELAWAWSDGDWTPGEPALQLDRNLLDDAGGPLTLIATMEEGRLTVLTRQGQPIARRPGRIFLGAKALADYGATIDDEAPRDAVSAAIERFESYPDDTPVSVLRFDPGLDVLRFDGGL